MYILVCGYQNGSVEYCGPFATESRANEYATIWRKAHSKIVSHHVAKILVPWHEHAMAKSMAQSEWNQGREKGDAPWST